MSFELSIKRELSAINNTANSQIAIETASDNDLVAAVLKGDETAFVTLFERHKRRIARLAARYFNRAEDVEEIIQISFTTAYFALKDFRGAYEKSFASWLLQITNHACLDALRSKLRRREDLHCELNETEIAFLHSFLRDESIETDAIFKDLANKLLARLKPEEQMVLRLLDAAEMSVQETSEITGWSISKVKTKAHRARKALQKILHKFL
jgi:RNA polymerase sigma-70 factor (ECF subfamily)